MRRNIAIIISSLSKGGAERVACDLSRILSKKHNVHLIVFFDDKIDYPYKGALHCLKKPTTKFKPLLNYRWMKQIRAIKKQEKIDVSISFMDIANIFNCYTNTGDLIVTSIHAHMTRSLEKVSIEKRAVRSWGIKVSNSHSDAIVAVSKDVESDLIKNFKAPKHKLRNIYNPCDIERLLELAEEHKADAARLGEKNCIVTMGRCTTQKVQWHLIRAMSEVVKAISDAKLFILGEGQLREKLEKLRNELGLIESVEFLGFIKNPHAYVRKCGVFVLPSLYEGFGNVIVEAMACGIPCISSDCHSGPREILAPGTEIKEQLDEFELAPYGILTSVCGSGNFNATDPLTPQELQLADAIIYLLQNDEVREEYARKGRERAKDFSPEIIAAEWEKLIE